MGMTSDISSEELSEEEEEEERDVLSEENDDDGEYDVFGGSSNEYVILCNLIIRTSQN